MINNKQLLHNSHNLLYYMIKNATIAPSQPVLLILYLKLKALVSIYFFLLKC